MHAVGLLSVGGSNRKKEEEEEEEKCTHYAVVVSLKTMWHCCANERARGVRDSDAVDL